jgi:hypothetical protein
MLKRLPAEYKPILDEINRREAEITNTLNETAEARRFHEEFSRRVGPFEAMMRAEGTDTLTATENLLKASHLLRSAPIPTRAGFIAQMVLQHLPRGSDGKDGIRALDDAFREMLGIPEEEGEARGARRRPDPREFRDPRLDAMIADGNRRRVEAEQSELNGYKTEIREFAKSHEFFADVRISMAKLFDAGLAKTWEDAYDQACQMNKEIRSILADRAASEKARKKGKPSTERAKAAMKSVRSTPVGGTRRPRPTSEADDIEADVAAAFEEVEGR